MPHKFSLCVTGRTKRTNRHRLFLNRVTNCHGKNKGNNYNEHIQNHTAHC